MPVRDPEHWLYRFSPREWIQAALAELGRAEAAFANRDRKGAMACCRRAAGMALNGALASAETIDEHAGRSYMDHVLALVEDRSAPEPVRDAAKLLAHTPLPGSAVVVLRTANTDEHLLEAARVVMSHAYAIVLKAEPSE
jgi:hypothetical protein